MEDGAIVEQGNHYELLEARGHYWALYNSQFAAAIDDDVVPGEGAPAAVPAVPAGAGR
jgi:ATP-binding cassette subfamily B protein